jgi:hypothetical protein
MRFTFACPDCQQPLRAPKAAVARWGQCPYCAIAFQIPDSLDEVEETAPPLRLTEAPEPVSSADGWTTVRTGFLIYRAGLMIGAPGLLAAMIAIGLTLAIGQDTDSFLRLFKVASGLVVFASLFMLLAGQFLCCSAPRESRARGTAVASVICYTLALLATVVFGLSLLGESSNLQNPWPMRRPGLPGTGIGPAVLFLTGIGAILGVVGHALFAAFMKTTAAFFRNKPLTRETGMYLWVFLMFGTGTLVACLALFMHAIDGGPISAAARRLVLLGITAVFAVFGLALFLWFLKLTGRARRTISRALQSITEIQPEDVWN